MMKKIEFTNTLTTIDTEYFVLIVAKFNTMLFP